MSTLGVTQAKEEYFLNIYYFQNSFISSPNFKGHRQALKLVLNIANLRYLKIEFNAGKLSRNYVKQL